MNLTDFLHKRLADLLDKHRVVVWYDYGGNFTDFVASFKSPNCEVISTEDSVLQARRRADNFYRSVDESENPAESNRNLLIYVPNRRGVMLDIKMQDLFEVYALAGTAFGDTEDQCLESLARQAMPQKADEITRLFREGSPTITLLDELEKAQRWPLLNEVFRTENPAEIIALAVCNDAKAATVDETAGCIDELLRLLESSAGFKSTSKARLWKSVRTAAAEYILFSEFVFDCPSAAPEALSAVPRATTNSKSVIYSSCDRMRSDTVLRDTYMKLAQEVEANLHLPEIIGPECDLGNRDTFPFEERFLLGRVVDAVVAGDLAAARLSIEGRKKSIWRLDSQRSPSWTALERATALLETAAEVPPQVSGKTSLRDLIDAYTNGGWFLLDRAQRLFETSLTSCLDEEDLMPVIDLCRCRYRETALKVQDSFLKAVQSEGWPPEGVKRQTRFFAEYVAPSLEHRERAAVFLVDSLRYEMGLALAEALEGHGEVDKGHAAAVVPTVTSCGMAALMPDADGMLRLVSKESGLFSALGNRLLNTSEDRMRLLSETYGDRFYETTLDELLSAVKKLSSKLKGKELVIVRTQDPDAIAEHLGAWRARRYLSDVVGDIAAAVRSVVSLGFDRVVITADHGHVMLPEIPPGDVVKTPSGDWLESKRRFCLGSSLSGQQGTIILKAGQVGIQGDVEDICLPVGLSVFSHGDGYFHGGLSLQEAIVPVVVFRAGGEPPVAAGKPEIEIRYRSDRFTSRVIGLTFYLQQSDLFGPPAQVRIEAYDGPGVKARLIGESADCEARDEKTREVTLKANEETPVPVLIEPDFDGPEIEIRVSDTHTRVVWARRKLKNAMLD